MISTPAPSSRIAARDPIVVLAADENFAIPLAVTIRSALENLAPDRLLRIFILDGGIRDATKQRLLRSWPADRYHLEWIRVDASALENLPVSGHINVLSYYRLLVPRVLPADVQRVIYLDADLIVRSDLGTLWDCDFAGNLCLAAQDVSAPYLDAALMLPNYQQCALYLSSANPVPNFRGLGLAADAMYFNAGVMLIDLDACRNADVTRECLECLEKYREHVLWWDQYALNIVLAGRWGALDVRWNQGAHAFRYPSWEQSPLNRQTFEQLRAAPFIVHFTTRDKPWLPLCRHPFRREFFEYLNRTSWAGWHPSRLKLMAELLRIQERQLRRGRKWLKNQARHWLRPTAHRAPS